MSSPPKARAERWARIMASAWRHRKFLGCDPDAVALWGMALSWSMDNKTDGVIEADAIPQILPVLSAARARAAVKVLTTRKLWDREPGGYKVHDFTDYNATDEYLESRRDAGRKAAEARWGHADRNANRNADGNTEEEEEVEEEKNLTTPRADRAGARETFKGFWTAYPRKVKKALALRAWLKLSPDQALVEQILAAVKAQAASPDWAAENGRYIPHPANWLRDRGWEDEVPAATHDDEEIERRRKILASVGVESRHMSAAEINEAHRKRFGAKNWRDDAKDSTARAAGFKNDADMQERIRAGIGSHDPWPPGHPKTAA